MLSSHELGVMSTSIFISVIENFLTAILGTSGAQALLKAVARNPGLETVLVPRTLVSWLNLAVRESFEGTVPGASNSYVRLTKSETGYAGAVTVGDFVHTFEANTVLNVAAALSVSMGVRDIPDTGIDPEQLQRLGKSLDLLVKAKALSEALGDDLRKAIAMPAQNSESLGSMYHTGHLGFNTPIASRQLPSGMYHHVYQSPAQHEVIYHSLSFDKDPRAPGVAQMHGLKEEGSPFAINMSQVHPDHKGHSYGKQLYAAALQHHGTMMSDSAVSGHAEGAWQHLAAQPGVDVKFGTPGTAEPHVATMNVAKVELPGQAGQPGAPEAPTPPSPQKKLPAGQGQKKQQQMQKRELRLREQDLQSRCQECGGLQFTGHRFRGCLCLRSLAKSVCVRQEKDDLWLEFGSALDADEIQVVIDSVRGS